jgi:arylsulfatase A-like enzyme
MEDELMPLLRRIPRTMACLVVAAALALAMVPVAAGRLGPEAEPPGPPVAGAQPAGDRPNVVLIMTDDQGYGDLGVHGNPALQTPHIDRLARESVQFEYFYVSPVCSPTRASLMTGRYNYRTGVVDTFLGRSLMHPGETTIAEVLSGAGYRTGIFGKWHLGDNYPMRAMDQGFQESLVLNGGGIGQPSDPVGGESYFDPVLRRNGEWTPTRGYVSDVITDGAIAFIRANRGAPFFTYLAFNAPHTPLQVPAAKYDKYRRILSAAGVSGASGPAAGNADPEVTAKIYGMVENVDDNVGRVLAALDELKLAERTIVIFMTDNGPQQPRYNAGLPQLKGTVHEGGIRVPFFVRHTGAFTPHTVDRIAAHIDVTPTLLEAAGVATPAAVRFDGRSLLPLLRGDQAAWPDRTLFFQWHRGDAPERRRAFAARSQRYKVVQPRGQGDTPLPTQAGFDLYDMAEDPREARNIAADRPDVVKQLVGEYDAWFGDVTSGRDYSDKGISSISLGAPEENPVRLTRQDWRGPQAGWTPASLGHWEVDVRQQGVYDVTLRFAPLAAPGAVHLSLGDRVVDEQVAAGATSATLTGAAFAPGPGRLESWVTQGDRRIGMLDVTVRLAQAPVSAPAEAPLNVIVILADDLGYGDLSSYGHPTIRTPQLDRMAAEGQRWTSFYAGAPVCSPSRAALLTGRLPVRTGVFRRESADAGPQGGPGVFMHYAAAGLPPEEVTLAEMLKARGYGTAIIGKWHLGHLPEYMPDRQGFDQHFGLPYSNDMGLAEGVKGGREIMLNPRVEYWTVPLLRNGDVVERPIQQQTLTKRYTEEAIAYIRENRSRPFFLYLAHTMPHLPLFRSKDFENRSAAGLYGDVIEELDWSVGEILNELRASGLDRRTLVVFTSDNGPWTVYDQQGGSAGPLREGKGSTWEGGLRVPGIFWSPGRVQPGAVLDIGATLDLTPTIAALTGARLPSDREIDGVDLSPVLLGRAPSPRETFAFWRDNELYAFRKGPWKAHFFTRGVYGRGPARVAHEVPELYNLGSDTGERWNVAEANPDVVRELTALAAAHRAGIRMAEPLVERRLPEAGR